MNKHNVLRYSSIILVSCSIVFTAICLFTDSWIVNLDRRTKQPFQWRGLWNRCMKNLHTLKVDCIKLDEKGIKGSDRASRYLLSISIASSGMILMTSLVMKIIKKIHMDIISAMILFTTISLCAGLSSFIEDNRSLAKRSNYYGYSLVLGEIAFVCLFTANIFSVISRLEKK